MLLFFACGDDKKKKNTTVSEEMTIEEFIDLYPTLQPPFSYSDTSFPVKENDTSFINKKIFTKFILDSTMGKLFGANAKPKFYPTGKFQNGKEETYLVTRGIVNDKKILLLAAFDKNKKYIAQLPLIRNDKKSKTSVGITIDSRFNIKKDITKILPDGKMLQGRDVYILNNASKKFMLIMTDSLGEASGELINPIDTLPHTQKYAGDYGDGKLNLVSLRDGERQGRMHVFIHLENETCEGEIKGEINFITPAMAEYKQGGDPCVLKFNFSGNTVRLTEVEGCGSRLGALQCSFDGTYHKLKPKTKTRKSAVK
jgi:hypothetical protein